MNTLADLNMLLDNCMEYEREHKASMEEKCDFLPWRIANHEMQRTMNDLTNLFQNVGLYYVIPRPLEGAAGHQWRG
ncbi:hypothetical protein RJT34_15633 [Clitoria ternatea]|uniref:Uncharacterized protein n=1 Tax=Clitoria ternatea TaxID=43366 RepID=A0AAN9J5T6_CLITE